MPVTMNIHIDFRSSQPIYLQIVEQVQGMIARGELRQGDQLPTVRQLATELRVNFNTVARAYRLLDEAGLISTQHGRGTYVWEAPTEETLQRLRQQSLEALTQHYLSEAVKLGYSPDEIRAVMERQIAAWKNGEMFNTFSSQT
jgi:DNA-binding transcriptional regulator YhcF (GntR family)